ncbi:MAG: hypothetical protein R3D27_03245 [Hyphomicrobiaceae bacterium]
MTDTTEFPDLDSLDHDEKLAAALGNMVVAWARAETVLVKAYAHAMQVHYNMAASLYYNIPTFESRVKALRAIVSDRPHPFSDREPILQAVSALSELAATRNMWVHGLWVIDPKRKVTRLFNMKIGGAKRRSVQVTVNAVRQHVQAVRERSRELAALLPLSISLYSSPDKPR